MKMVYWIAGPQGSGKSTLAKAFEDAGLAVCYPGRMCRQEFGEKLMAQSLNPTAPPETEAYVRALIERAIDVNPILAIDGCPRGVEQTRWMQILTAHVQAFHVVIWVTAPPNLRMTRIEERSTTDDQMELAAARAKTEYQTLLPTLEGILAADVPVIVINNDRNVEDPEAFLSEEAHRATSQR